MTSLLQIILVTEERGVWLFISMRAASFCYRITAMPICRSVSLSILVLIAVSSSFLHSRLSCDCGVVIIIDQTVRHSYGRPVTRFQIFLVPSPEHRNRNKHVKSVHCSSLQSIEFATHDECEHFDAHLHDCSSSNNACSNLKPSVIGAWNTERDRKSYRESLEVIQRAHVFED